MSDDNRNGGDDSEDTPPHGTRLRYSAEALNLLDVALAVQQFAVNLREAAVRIDGLSGLARESLRAELEQRFASIGSLCLEAAAALKDGL